MFGARIRNWVETHFVRHRKKRSKEAKNSKDPPPPAEVVPKSSPSAHTDPGPSTQPLTSAICHHNPATSSSTQTTKRVTLVSPTLSCKFSYTDENTGSPKRPTLHAAINNNNNRLGARYSSYLSSPESAYSTGYSTDATSPYEPSIDATLSPEYYINIRTGTRYFQSVDIDLQNKPETLRTFGSGQINQRADLISKRGDCNRGGGLRSFGATPPQPPPRKSSIPDSIFAQNEKHRASSIKELNCKSSPVQQQQYCNSPRQRCRIRTNPWLPSTTASDTNLNASREVNNSKSGASTHPEPAVPLTPLNEDISTAATIGSWHVADSTTTCDEESCDEDEDVFLKEKPIRRRQVAAIKKRSNSAQAPKKRGSFSSDSTLLSTPSISRCSSVEDATLNELGRFEESYTYDKETDILSDSDATDCEVDETITASSRTVNEQSTSTTHTLCEMELDYIDVGEQFDTQVVHHEAHCTYHLSYNHSEFKHLNSSAASSKLKRASQRRNRSRGESPALPTGVDSPVLRLRRVEGVESPLIRARGVLSPSLKNRRVESPIAQVIESKESPSLKVRGIDSPALRNKILPEKSGGSGNSTPLVRRRPSVGSNCSTPRLTRHCNLARSESNNSTPVRKAPADLPLVKSEDKSKSSLSSKYSASELKLIQADKEADRKYRQLIKEAESLLVHMRNVTVEEVDLETPTVEAPVIPFPPPPVEPPQPRPDPARLSIKIQKASSSTPAYPAVTVTTPSGGPPRALVTFRSVDLNSPVASEAPYCPQSEPVKRKVYSSAAMQRLQEHFKLTEMDESSDSSPPEAEENSSADHDTSRSNESTCEYGTQEERRKRRQEARIQYKLAVARRSNVLSILEELKLNLQTQSARLHDTYRSTTDLRSPCLGDVTPSPMKANTPFGPLNIFSPIRRATNSATKSPKHH